MKTMSALQTRAYFSQTSKLNIGFVAIYFLIIGVGPVATFGIPQTPRETSQSTVAERLWEQAIAAKGGREALHGVRNLVVSAGRDYPSRKLKKNQLRQEVLYVLPDKFWSWSDYRPDVFGLRVEMYNFEMSTKYVISDGEPHRQLEPINEWIEIIEICSGRYCHTFPRPNG